MTTDLISTPAGTLFDFEPETISGLVRPTDPGQMTVFDCIAEAEAERAEPCVTCAYYGVMSCRESVGTCDLCKRYGDVNMDYSKSGDRERPDETVCLDCLADGAHIAAAHEPEPEDPAVIVHDLFEAIWTGAANGFSEAKLTASLAESEQMLADLEAKRISPTRVVGRGVLKPLTTAREYLWRVIHEARRDLITHGRTNCVNAANVHYHLPADHPGKGHRMHVATEATRDNGRLGKIVCSCTPEGQCGYSAPTIHDASTIEAHLSGKKALR